MTRPTTIYLVRHAESRPSADVAEPDWPLSERGREQALALVAAMQALAIDVIYSSPYPRALHTVLPLAHALGKEVTVVPALRERALSRSHLGDQFRATLDRYWADADFALPDGESNRACAARMTQAIGELAARHRGETIALASHGNALALYLGTLDPGFGYDQWRAMSNPDLFRIVYEGGHASWDGTRLPTSIGGIAPALRGGAMSM
jgi:2,3-bisphosphoglycerate-dependent phosphoglycerate mutase